MSNIVNKKSAEDSIARRDMLSKNKDMKYLYFNFIIYDNLYKKHNLI